jgi:hypothetical protein
MLTKKYLILSFAEGEKKEPISLEDALKTMDDLRKKDPLAYQKQEDAVRLKI